MEVGASKVKKFKRVLRRDPNSWDANMGLALIHFKRGELVEALPHAEKASKIDPASADAKALLGSIYMALDRDAKAEECLADAIKLGPRDYDSYSRLAEVRYRRSDIGGAVEILRDATELFPRNPETFNDLGVMYYLRGNVDQAEEQFDKALSIEPKNGDALFNLAAIYLEQDESDKAVETLEKLIEVEPDRAVHHRDLGLARLRAGEAEAAAKHFEKAIALDPDDAEAHYDLGVSLSQLDQLDASVRSLEKCLELVPEHRDAIFAVIGCHAKKGETEQIVKLWEKSIGPLVRAGKERSAVQPKLSAGKVVAPVGVMEGIERRVEQLAEQEVEISVVVPPLNDADNIRPLHDKLTSVLESIGKEHEIVYVDDGTRDDALNVLRDINLKDDRARVVILARDYGQAASLSAGFDRARGNIIVTVNGDLPDAPADIPAVLDKMAESCDVVSRSAGGRYKPLMSRVAAKLAGLKLDDYDCILAAYDKSALDNMPLCGEMYRFIPAVARWLGLPTAEIPAKEDASAGAAVRGSTDATPSVLDMITAKFLMNKTAGPMRFFAKIAFGSMGVGIIIAILLEWRMMFAGKGIKWDSIFPELAFFAFVAAFLIAVGFVAEIIVRTHGQSQRKPIYIVKKIIE